MRRRIAAEDRSESTVRPSDDARHGMTVVVEHESTSGGPQVPDGNEHGLPVAGVECVPSVYHHKLLVED